MNQILQPGQIRLQCDHQQDHSGNDPVQPVTAHMGATVAVIGGLTCREEIASRILAARIAYQGFPSEDFTMGPTVECALMLTDALLAKTRPKSKPPEESR